jgi:hypothetical protein
MPPPTAALAIMPLSHPCSPLLASAQASTHPVILEVSRSPERISIARMDLSKREAPTICFSLGLLFELVSRPFCPRRRPSCSNRRTECSLGSLILALSVFSPLTHALCRRRFILFLRTVSGAFIRTIRLPSEPPPSPPFEPSHFPSVSPSSSPPSVPSSSPSAPPSSSRSSNHPAPRLRRHRHCCIGTLTSPA